MPERGSLAPELIEGPPADYREHPAMKMQPASARVFFDQLASSSLARFLSRVTRARRPSAFSSAAQLLARVFMRFCHTEGTTPSFFSSGL